MKFAAAVLFAILSALPASAAPTHFAHIVLMIQENRTPDNLFYALCAVRPCSTQGEIGTYDIQVDHWLDKNTKRGTIKPRPLPLDMQYDPYHDHAAFLAMCDYDSATSACRMDGAADIPCGGHCPPNTSLTYVDNSQGVINPYLFLAENYGWANFMFQTNQGPSFPAHQFLFGATSAPSGRADHRGTFAAENAKDNVTLNGCIAPSTTNVALINAKGVEFTSVYPCFEHKTLGDLLDQAKISWRYYSPAAGSLWTAPDAIRHICQPATDSNACMGAIWRAHVTLRPTDVLTDIKNCQLPQASWVIPSGQYSDHAKMNTGGGPLWVATVIDAIGNSPCLNSDGTSYWNSTAIVVTWDDFGGLYDHEPPTFLPYPQGGYQYGFRVPLLFVSAYTAAGTISNNRLDFGSIVRFVEYNFGIPMGKLTFADARTTENLAEFYNLSATPRPFKSIGVTTSSRRFDGGDPRLEPPDDD